MTRAARALLDLNAIRKNYRLAKKLSGAARAVAVIKSDAYGHGAIPVAKALEAEADAFGVACLEEAIALRDAGISTRILLLEGFFEPSELGIIDWLNLDLVIHSTHQLQQFLNADLNSPLNIWLKLDTGMHRLGLSTGDFLESTRLLSSSPKVNELILMSHFAQADDPGCKRTTDQLQFFNQVTADIPLPTSLANSPAVLAWPQTHGDWIRPGMMLYGVSPLTQSNANSLRLEPVMTLESELIAIRTLGKGEPIGYGTHYHCDRPTLVGVVAIGYGDGYPRHARNGTPVLVRGKRCPLIGRVSMDMLTIDLTELEAPAIGDLVTLWGKWLPVEEVASWCDSIPYELVTTLTKRVPRQYS
ncbi:MAG: alanine racemase [Motiliproteus sp.]